MTSCLCWYLQACGTVQEIGEEKKAKLSAPLWVSSSINTIMPSVQVMGKVLIEYLSESTVKDSYQANWKINNEKRAALYFVYFEFSEDVHTLTQWF